MWEDKFQVYERHGDGKYILLASDMRIYEVIVFIKALFEESINEQSLRIEIRRRPKEGN